MSVEKGDEKGIMRKEEELNRGTKRKKGNLIKLKEAHYWRSDAD